MIPKDQGRRGRGTRYQPVNSKVNPNDTEAKLYFFDLPNSLPLRQLSYCLGNFRQLGVSGAALQPQPVIDGRSAADHGSGGNVVRDAALGDGDGSVSDLDVAGDAYLSGENHVVAYIRRSGQADLRDEQRVVAYGATVADLDQVVDLRAAPNAGFANAGAVDAGVGLDLDVAFDDHVAGLTDIVPVSRVVLGEAKPVDADLGAVLQQNVVSQSAEFPDHGVSVREEIVADGDSAIDDDVSQQDGVVSDDDVFVDHHIGTNVRILAQLGRG